MTESGERGSLWRDFRIAGLVTVAFALGQLSTGYPETALQWGFLVGGSLAAGLLARTAVIDYLWNLVKRMPVRKTVLVLVVLAPVLLTGRLVAVVGPPLVHAVRIELSGCPQPVQLRVATTPEGLASARELTDAFEVHTARDNFHCPTTIFYVYPAEPTDTRDAIARGWGPEHLSALGPRPDLWLPGSTRFEPPSPGGERLSHVESVPVAWSPIVLAVPDDLIGDDPRVERRDLTWAQALGSARDRKWSVARPDPSASVAGMLATMAVYESLGAQPGRPLDAARAREVEREFERALDTHKYPLADPLCRHLGANPPRSAVIVAEQELERFNRGLPLGGQCAGQPAAHGTRLEQITPEPTRVLDHPVVRLEWTDGSADQARLGREFVEWLAGSEGRDALRAAGLRPGAAPAGRPTPEDQRYLDAYAQATRPGRILLALDTSGSMRQPLSGGASRFSVAVQGVTAVAAMMGARDELGLWAFPAVGGRQELMPIGPRAPLPALDAIVPTGPTPLYRTIADGVRSIPSGDEAARALVVLTDGEDSGGGVTAQQMLGEVPGAGVRVFVVAVGEANCASQALAQVTQGTGGACLETDFAGLEATLSQVFTLLWKGA